MKKLGAILLQRPLYAAWAALLFALLPFIGIPSGWASAVIVAFITLRLGAKSGLLVLCWSALPAAALYFWNQPALLINMVILHNGLVFVLALVLRHYRSWSLALEVGALLGVVAVVIVHSMSPDISHWWVSQFQGYVSKMSEEIKMAPERIEETINLVAKFATGVTAILLLLANLFSLFIARWWQATMFNPGGLGEECKNIRMGYLASMILLVAVIGSLMGSKIALDTLPVVILPFSLAALSLVHKMLAHNKAKIGVLVMMYGLLFFFTPYIAIMLSVLALVDSLFDLRKYLVPTSV